MNNHRKKIRKFKLSAILLFSKIKLCQFNFFFLILIFLYFPFPEIALGKNDESYSKNLECFNLSEEYCEKLSFGVQNDQPVWEDYLIPEISFPLMIRKINSKSWWNLRDIFGIGDKITINHYATDWVPIARSHLHNYSDHTTYIDPRYGTRTKGFEWNSIPWMNLTKADYEKIKPALFTLSLDESVADYRYMKIQNVNDGYYLNSSYYVPGCDWPAAKYWIITSTPRRADGLSWYAKDEFGYGQGRSISLHEAYNNHTPYYNMVGSYYLCANGDFVQDPNVFEVNRLRSTILPLPYRTYPLNQQTRSCSLQSPNECGVERNVRYVNDRFGIERSAMTFGDTISNIGHASLPTQVLEHLKQTNGFTISFWAKYQSKNITHDSNSYPGVNDTWASAFWGSLFSDRPAFGVSVNENGAVGGGSTGHIAMIRFSDLRDKRFNWHMWFPDGVRLNPQSGDWTLYVLRYEKEKTQIFIFNPENYRNKNSPNYRKPAITTYNFFQNTEEYMDNIVKWGVGRAPGDGSSVGIDAISSLLVFDQVLTDSQIHDVINAQIVGDHLN